MTRPIRTVLSLFLIGFLVMGSDAMGLCICADGKVALEMGCDGDCPGSGAVQDGGQHTGIIVVSGAGDGDCVYVPFSTEALLHSGAIRAKLPVPAKGFPLGASHAIHLNSSRVDGVCANGSHARRAALLPSAALLAQRTVILRI